jgi:biotin carboxyl carrier protein
MIPGRVHSVLFRGGATVPAHEPLLIVESLGMLIPHALPVEVRIHRWKVAAEDRVFAGQELAEFEILAK